MLNDLSGLRRVRSSIQIMAVTFALTFAQNALQVPASADMNAGMTPLTQAATRPYMLAANDQLSITVSGHDELTRTVSILSDGTFAFPGVGTINAAGMTVRGLTKLLVGKLSDTINEPDVTVSVVSSVSQRVSVVGAVKTPGQYQIQPTARLLDVIAAAGGLSSDPEVTQATLISANSGNTVSVDIPGLMNSGNSALNLPVQPGDVLLVQAGTLQQVQVTGEVTKPGSYPTNCFC